MYAKCTFQLMTKTLIHNDSWKFTLICGCILLILFFLLHFFLPSTFCFSINIMHRTPTPYLNHTIPIKYQNFKMAWDLKPWFNYTLLTLLVANVCICYHAIFLNCFLVRSYPFPSSHPNHLAGHNFLCPPFTNNLFCCLFPSLFQ